MGKLEELFVEGGSLTWINHYSAQVNMRVKTPLDLFDAVGIDGFLLRTILRSNVKHTSADSSLARFIATRGMSVGLIGGSKEDSLVHKSNFENLYPNTQVLWSFDGFGQTSESNFDILLQSKTPNLIVIGMGAGLQEIEALKISEKLKSEEKICLVATCGGWLDQLSYKNYYPRWAVRNNLKWLVRLAKEPNRLWLRYTYWAARSIVKRLEILEYCSKISLLSDSD